MFKKTLLFGVGALFGAYMMKNHIYRKISRVIIEHTSKNHNEETKTSETGEES